MKAIDLAHEPVGALQGEVASAIAREIRIQVSPKEKQRLAQSRRVKPEAYLAYSYGRYCWNKRAVPRYYVLLRWHGSTRERCGDIIDGCVS